MANEKLIVKTDIQVQAEKILTGELKQQLVRSLRSLNIPTQELEAQFNIQPEANLTPAAIRRFRQQSKARLKEIDKVLAETQGDGYQRPSPSKMPATPADQLRVLDNGSLAALRQYYALLDRLGNQISEGEKFAGKKFQAAIAKARSGAVLNSGESKQVQEYTRYLQGQKRVVESINNMMASAAPSYVNVPIPGKRRPARVEAAQVQLGSLSGTDIDKTITQLKQAVALSAQAVDEGARAGATAKEVLAQKAKERQREKEELRASQQARRNAIVITDDDKKVMANLQAQKAVGFRDYNLGRLKEDMKVVDKFRTAAALEAQMALGPRGGNTAESKRLAEVAGAYTNLAAKLADLPKMAEKAALAISKAESDVAKMQQQLQYKTGQALYNRKGRAAAGQLLADGLPNLDKDGLQSRLAAANAADYYLSEQQRRARQLQLSGRLTPGRQALVDRVEGQATADRAVVKAIKKELEERLTGVAALKEMNASLKQASADARESAALAKQQKALEKQRLAEQKVAKTEAYRRTLGDKAQAAIRNAGGIDQLDLIGTKAALPGLRTGLDQAKKDREQAAVQYGLGSQQYNDKDANYQKLAKDIDAVNGRMQALRKDAAAATRETKNLSGAMGQLSEVTQLFVRYALFYGGFYAILAGISALIGGVVDLEKQLKSIQAVAGATADQMQGVNAAIKDVAQTTKFSLTEVAEATKTLVQAGVLTQDIDRVLRSTANFAQATETSLTTAADVVTSMRDVYKELDDAKIADQLTKTINLSKLSGEGLKTIVSLGAQVSSSYGLNSQQFLSASAVLKNAGLRESTVGTGLRQGILEIFTPDKKTTAALKKRYSEIGEGLNDSQIQQRFADFTKEASPLVAALKELRRLGLGGENSNAFARVFDVRAENAIKALINNLEELEATETRIALGSPALSASRTQMEALANQVDNLKGALTVLTDSLLSDFIPGLTDGVRALSEEISNLADKNQEIKALTGYGYSSAALAGVGTGLAAAALTQGSIYKRVAAFGVGTVAGTAGTAAGMSQGADSGSGFLTTAGATLGNILSLLPVLMLFGGKAKGIDFKTVAEGAKNLPLLFSVKFWGAFGKIADFVKAPGVVLRSLGLLFRLLGGIPGLLVGVGTVIAGILLSGDSQQEALKAQLAKGAKLGSDTDKQREQAANYTRNAAGGTAEGTTARAIRDYERMQDESENALARAFGGLSEKSDLRAALERMGKYGQEKGSRAQAQIAEDIDQILKGYGSGLAELQLNTDQLAELSTNFAESSAKAKGIREDIAQTLRVAREQEEQLLADEKATGYSPELALLRASREGQSGGMSIFQRLTGRGELSNEELGEALRELQAAADQADADFKAANLRKTQQNFGEFRRSVASMLNSTEFVSEQLTDTLQKEIDSLAQQGLSIPQALQMLIGDVDAQLEDIDRAIRMGVSTDSSTRGRRNMLLNARGQYETALKEQTEAQTKFLTDTVNKVRGDAAVALSSLAKLSPEQLKKFSPEDRQFIAGLPQQVLRDPSQPVSSANIKEGTLVQVFPQRKAVDESETYERIQRLTKVASQALQDSEADARAKLEDQEEASRQRAIDVISDKLAELQSERALLADALDKAKETVGGTNTILQEGGINDQLVDLDRSIAEAQLALKLAEAKAALDAAPAGGQARAEVRYGRDVRTAQREFSAAMTQSALEGMNRTTEVLKIQAGYYDAIRRNQNAIVKLTEERAQAEADAAGNLEAYMEAFSELSRAEIDEKKRERDTFIATNKDKAKDGVYATEIELLNKAVEDAEMRYKASLATERAKKSGEFTQQSLERVDALRVGEAEDQVYGRPMRLADQKDRLEATRRLQEADLLVQKEEYIRLQGLAAAGDTQAVAALNAQTDAYNKAFSALERTNAEMQDFARTNEQIHGSVLAIADAIGETDWAAAVGGLKASAVETEAIFRDGLLSVIDQSGDAFADIMLSMGNNAESFGKRFKRIIRSALDDLAKFLVKQAFLGMVQQGLGALGGLFGFGAARPTPAGQMGDFTAAADFGAYARDGKVIEGYASGGMITGPGTGRSDSIYGAIIGSDGKRKRGIKVSNGEAILNARVVRQLGKTGVDALNKEGVAALQQQAVTMVQQLPSSTTQNVAVSVPIAIQGDGSGGGSGEISAEQRQQLSRLIEVRMVDLLKAQMRPGGILNRGTRK